MPRKKHRVFIGEDANELRACTVANYSMVLNDRHGSVRVERISRLRLGPLRYTRPTTRMPSGQLFDEISGAPMSTDHAIARFFLPYFCGYEGWALFTDGDVLARADVGDLFAFADDRYAIRVVQHPPLLEEREKKTGHIQQAYPRKNWSSVMLINCGHPANKALTLEVCNGWPGRDLHAFRWLDDELIGALPDRWNYLVGVTPPQADPALVHYTLGTPDTPGHGEDPFAEEWFRTAKLAGYRIDREALRA